MSAMPHVLTDEELIREAHARGLSQGLFNELLRRFEEAMQEIKSLQQEVIACGHDET